MKCATAAATRCDKVCERTRNCGKHSCQSVCHSGPCDPCSVTITQVIEHHYISVNSHNFLNFSTDIRHVKTIIEKSIIEMDSRSRVSIIDSRNVFGGSKRKAVACHADN